MSVTDIATLDTDEGGDTSIDVPDTTVAPTCPTCEGFAGIAAGTAQRESPNYALQIAVGSPAVTQHRSSPNYALNIGLGGYAAGP